MPVYVKPSLSSVNASLNVFTRPALDAVNFDLGIRYLSAFISPSTSTEIADILSSRNLLASISAVIENPDDAVFTICIYIEDIVVQVAINRVQFATLIETAFLIGQKTLSITSSNVSIVWGQQTGVTETIEGFSERWSGTGAIVNTGDGEEIELEEGQYMECSPVNTGIQRIEIIKDGY